MSPANAPADSLEEDCPVPPPALWVAAAAVPTYLDDIKPLMTTKCAYCHSATAPANLRETPYLTTYDEVKVAASESLTIMQRGRMPPRNAQPPLGADDVPVLTSWINGGFIMGTPPPPVDPADPVYYEPTVRNLLSQSCVGCHKPGQVPPDLSSYAAAKSAARVTLSSVTEARMPPGTMLDAAALAALRSWIDDGMPEAATNDGEAPPPVSGLPMDPCDLQTSAL